MRGNDKFYAKRNHVKINFYCSRGFERVNDTFAVWPKPKNCFKIVEDLFAVGRL